MTEIKELTSNDDVDAWVAESGPRWLLKHSNSCGISTAAFDVFKEHLVAAGDQPAAIVIIQEHRPVSNYIAEKLGRVHQSPQIFLLHDGEVVWTATHWSIKADAMKEAFASVS